jgi:prepilin-type N-terminal cleavage/methylation domain-containing protein
MWCVREAVSRPRAVGASRDERGFTVVELAIVMGVVAILISIAGPSVLGARERASDRATQASVHTGGQAAFVYVVQASRFDDTPTALATLDDIEPGLDFVNGATVSTGPKTISIAQDAEGQELALAALSPPQIVAVVGKVRAFRPEEGVVYTSIRPEVVMPVTALERARQMRGRRDEGGVRGQTGERESGNSQTRGRREDSVTGQGTTSLAGTTPRPLGVGYGSIHLFAVNNLRTCLGVPASCSLPAPGSAVESYLRNTCSSAIVTLSVAA